MVHFSEFSPDEPMSVLVLYINRSMVLRFLTPLPEHSRAWVSQSVSSRTQCIRAFISSIFRSICIDSIPNIWMISIHVCLGIVMARIYVLLTLSCPSRAFSWRGGAEYSVVVWIIFSTTPMLVAGRLLIVQYKIKAKMILQPSLGTVLIKSEIEATDPS